MLLSDELNHLDTAIDECISLGNEAFNASDITGDLLKRVDRTIATVKDTYRNVINFDYTRPEVINVSQVRNVLNRMKYLDLETAMVDGPVSFNPQHDLLEYASTLERFMTEMAEQYKVINVEVEGIIGKFLSEPELFSEPPLPEWQERFGVEAENMIPSTKELSPFFDGSRRSSFAFVELYGRSADCVTTCTKVNHLNQTRWATLNPRKIQDKVKRVNQITTEVMKKVGSLKKAHGETIRFLMNIVLYVALWVRQFANMTTLQLDLTAALKTTEKKLLAL